MFQYSILTLVVGAACVNVQPGSAHSHVSMTAREGQRRFALGGNMFSTSYVPDPVNATGMRLLRLWINSGLSGDDTPVNLTTASADAWVNATIHTHGDIDTLRLFAEDAAKLDVNVLVSGGAFGTPYLVPGQKNVFDAARVNDAAMIWAAMIDRISQPDCMKHSPAYVELSNEPNGHWNTYIEPSVWVKLACAVRAALDARGLRSVGISGPGTSMGSSSAYLQAMVNAGSIGQCVSLLSVHTWEDPHTFNGPHEMASLLSTYEALRIKFDPQHELYWVATEFGSRTDRIGNESWPSLEQCYDVVPCYSNATNCFLPSNAEILSSRFATRVGAFTLLHMNSQFDSALYWWVADYGWSPLCYGLVTRNGTTTAPFTMFTQIFMKPGFELSILHPVLRTWEDDDTVTGAGVGDDGRAVLWVAHAPTLGLEALTRTINVSGVPPGAQVSGMACYPSGCTVSATNSDSFNNAIAVSVTVPAHAIIAVFFESKSPRP